MGGPCSVRGLRETVSWVTASGVDEGEEMGSGCENEHIPFPSEEALLTPFFPASETPSSSLFSQEEFVSNEPAEKNVRPDLTHGKGTGMPPALGVNGRGLPALARFVGTLALLQR